MTITSLVAISALLLETPMHYALFGDMQDGHSLFIKETRAGKPLSPEDGRYPNEVNPYDPNPHGTDEDDIEEIIRTTGVIAKAVRTTVERNLMMGLGLNWDSDQMGLNWEFTKRISDLLFRG